MSAKKVKCKIYKLAASCLISIKDKLACKDCKYKETKKQY